MKQIWCLLLVSLFIPLMAMGQEAGEAAKDAAKEVVEVVKPAADAAAQAIEVGGADITDLLKAIGGIQGGGTLAIIMLIVQLLMWLLNGFFAGKAGKYKLVAVMGLTLVAGVVALMMQGMSLGAALLHSSTIASAQVLLNQTYKQFFVKKDS